MRFPRSSILSVDIALSAGVRGWKNAEPLRYLDLQGNEKAINMTNCAPAGQDKLVCHDKSLGCARRYVAQTLKKEFTLKLKNLF